MTDTPAAPATLVMTPIRVYSLTPSRPAPRSLRWMRAIHPPPSVVPQDAQDASATVGPALARRIVGGELVQGKCGNTKTV